MFASKLLSFRNLINPTSNICKLHSYRYGCSRRCSSPHHPPSSFVSTSAIAAASNRDIISADAERSSKVNLGELGLKPEQMPKHVAIIMDGNRRWASNRMLPCGLGHLAGKETLKQLAIRCSELGIQVLTVFAFSTENWTRPNVCSRIIHTFLS